jgi:hypothetical protein
MANDLQHDFQDFQGFLASKFSVGEPPVSLEQALQEFRAYQRDLEKFQADTRQSLAESARGQSSPLDIDSVLERGRERLARKGISD